MKRTLFALIPLAVLIGLLALNISIFGADSILGASQVALLAAAGVAIGLSMWRYKTPWSQTVSKNGRKCLSSGSPEPDGKQKRPKMLVEWFALARR